MSSSPLQKVIMHFFIVTIHLVPVAKDYYAFFHSKIRNLSAIHTYVKFYG